MKQNDKHSMFPYIWLYVVELWTLLRFYKIHKIYKFLLLVHYNDLYFLQ